LWSRGWLRANRAARLNVWEITCFQKRSPDEGD
jgi:hypothetical protein